MSVRAAPRAQPVAFQAAGPPPPTGARLAEVLAAGERHADATGTNDGDRWKAAGNAAKMAAKMTAPTAPAAKPKSWLERKKDEMMKGASEMGAKMQENAKAYGEQKAKDVKAWNDNRMDDAAALKDLREQTALAVQLRKKFGPDGPSYKEAASKAKTAYKNYRETYWMQTREGKYAAPLDKACLKAAYEKYEREVSYNDTRSKLTDPRGVPETISAGFDDDGELLAAEMEAAGTALCCEEEEEDDVAGMLYKFLNPGFGGADLSGPLKELAVLVRAWKAKEAKEGADAAKNSDEYVKALGKYKDIWRMTYGKDTENGERLLDEWYRKRARRLNWKGYSPMSIDAPYGFQSEGYDDELDAADVDTGEAMYNGFLPTYVRRAGYFLSPARQKKHDEIVRELLELREKYRAGEHQHYKRIKTLLWNYRDLHYLPQPKDGHPSVDTPDTRAKSFLNPYGWIEAGFEPGIDQEEVGCGWSAARGMQYPCAMVFTMIGADGVTRLYCASGKPPSAYDNASQLRPLSSFNSELREMLEELSGMWPGSPRYTNYVLVPAGQSEPEPEPKPTTKLRIPISELETPDGAAKLTQYVMDWLKQMNVKINEDEKTNTELNGVTTRRGAVGVPINAGRRSRFKDTADATRVAKQLQAAFRARRNARAREGAGAAAAARAGQQ